MADVLNNPTLFRKLVVIRYVTISYGVLINTTLVEYFNTYCLGKD